MFWQLSKVWKIAQIAASSHRQLDSLWLWNIGCCVTHLEFVAHKPVFVFPTHTVSHGKALWMAGRPYDTFSFPCNAHIVPLRMTLRIRLGGDGSMTKMLQATSLRAKHWECQLITSLSSVCSFHIILRFWIYNWVWPMGHYSLKPCNSSWT